MQGSPDTESPVNAGYQIDVAILNDPLSDDAYIYWGNRYMAGARLNPDMMSIDESTITVMTPQGGTDETFRYNGAPYVLYRNATYYFMWSVGNVKSKNYHVAYGTSTSPLGPIKVADEPIILAPDSANPHLRHRPQFSRADTAHQRLGHGLPPFQPELPRPERSSRNAP